MLQDVQDAPLHPLHGFLALSPPGMNSADCSEQAASPATSAPQLSMSVACLGLVNTSNKTSTWFSLLLVPTLPTTGLNPSLRSYFPFLNRRIANLHCVGLISHPLLTGTNSDLCPCVCHLSKFLLAALVYPLCLHCCPVYPSIIVHWDMDSTLLLLTVANYQPCPVVTNHGHH